MPAWCQIVSFLGANHLWKTRRLAPCLSHAAQPPTGCHAIIPPCIMVPNSIQHHTAHSSQQGAMPSCHHATLLVPYRGDLNSHIPPHVIALMPKCQEILFSWGPATSSKPSFRIETEPEPQGARLAAGEGRNKNEGCC